MCIILGSTVTSDVWQNMGLPAFFPTSGCSIHSSFSLLPTLQIRLGMEGGEETVVGRPSSVFFCPVYIDCIANFKELKIAFLSSKGGVLPRLFLLPLCPNNSEM